MAEFEKLYARLAAADPQLCRPEQLQRLATIDSDLASPVGMKIDAMAATLGCDPKTIRRLIATLNRLGHSTESISVGDRRNGESVYYVFRYTGKRLMSARLAQILAESIKVR